MKKLLVLFAVLGLAVAPLGCGKKDKGKTTTSAPAKGPSTKEGKVVKVDADGKKITVKVGDKDEEIAVPEGAKVTVGGEDKTLADVTADMNVTVKMDKDGKVTEVAATAASAPMDPMPKPMDPMPKPMDPMPKPMDPMPKPMPMPSDGS